MNIDQGMMSLEVVFGQPLPPPHLGVQLRTALAGEAPELRGHDDFGTEIYFCVQYHGSTINAKAQSAPTNNPAFPPTLLSPVRERIIEPP